ncbi:MAG TPA: HAMP domain-containing sensor histidine kinase [Gaiellaceae bacterium]|nr:HAMP domain-containing sensor histidine kinase [Gaiellaceae bacterium]
MAIIVPLPEWEANPIHLIWLSLTLVYWVQRWPVGFAMVVLASIFVLTATVQLWTASRLGNGLSERWEAPLLAFMFGAIVWHTHRRWHAVDETRRLADAQGEFVSDTSHELRTPITVARGHAELIRSAYPGHQAAADADVIIEELDCLWTMSDRLLVLAKAEHPSLIQCGPVDVGLVLGHTATRWELAARHDWCVNIELPGRFLADQDLLVSAFHAVLENAPKFTDEEDTISVKACVEGDVAVIEIEDSGIGIAPDDLSSIFDRFFRAGGRRSRDGGTGLGLAIVKAIVEAHNGTISVRSELGVGEAFRMCFPGIVPSIEPVVEVPREHRLSRAIRASKPSPTSAESAFSIDDASTGCPTAAAGGVLAWLSHFSFDSIRPR